MSAATRRQRQAAPADGPSEAPGVAQETRPAAGPAPGSPPKRKARRGAVPCPSCRSRVSAVLKTTPRPDGVTRKRRCAGCGKKFVTTERVTLDPETDSAVRRLATGVASLVESLARPVAPPQPASDSK